MTLHHAAGRVHQEIVTLEVAFSLERCNHPSGRLTTSASSAGFFSNSSFPPPGADFGKRALRVHVHEIDARPAPLQL